VAQKERIFFSNNCTFFYFQYKKNYVNTKTTCNKCSFDYLHWLLNYGKLYRKDGVLLAVHTSGASPQSSASHLLTFLVAQLQFFPEWKLSDRRLYEVFKRRLLIWGNPKETDSPDYYPFKKYTFFLCHPVIYYSSDSPSSLITELLSVTQSLSSLSSPSSSHRMSSSDPSKTSLMQRITVKALVTSVIIRSVYLVGKGQLKERCRLEPWTNIFHLRNWQKLVRIRFGCGFDSRVYGILEVIMYFWVGHAYISGPQRG